ncbi:MAG: T9SS type A sorting domain-containing protein [Chitinophagaceae bacterium]
MRKNFTLCFLVAGLFTYESMFAADFTVTSTADSGPGTLRQAIADAAANPGPDNILFNIAASPAMITLNSSLTIGSQVFIDGYTQPGATQGPVNARQLAVSLNFNDLANGNTPAAYDGLIITTGNVTIRGVAIFRASRGIVINGPAGTGGAVKIQGNTIGLSESNQTAVEDINTGDFVATRNGSHGIFFAQTTSGFVVPRVFVGVDGDGTNDANEGNLITNNGGDGIFLNIADFNVIAGNFIGTTATGALPASVNSTNNNGITIDGVNTGDGASNNRIGTDGDGVSDALEGNLISGNRKNGIVLQRRAQFNKISGNTIGLSLVGGGAAGNGRVVGVTPPVFLTEGNGILLNNVSNNTIGVDPSNASAAQRNYVSSNFHNGITLYSSIGGANGFVQNNTVMGNVVGSNANGDNRGNLKWGVFLTNTPTSFLVTSNFIGSNDDGSFDNLEGNTIAYNQRDGVGMLDQSIDFVIENRISRNSMFSNNRPGGGTEGYGLGINLMTSITDGTTPNSPSGSGPNFLYNFPVTTDFKVNTGSSEIEVTGSAPSGAFVQYYIASADANQDAPLFNEGQTFLFGLQEGGLEDQDPGDGTFKFVVPFSNLAAPVTVGAVVVALAHNTTSDIGSTSEFSQASITTLLPVQFVSFKAELQSDKVLVSWATAQEQNASHFDVERSTNGRDFTKIGQVKAAGNSNVLVNYSFTDNNPVLGVSYYRLRQVDIDNRFVYTKTVIIRNEARSKAFTVWPNPVLDNVNVTLQSDKNQNLSLRVVDYNGRVVRSQVVNATRGVNQITVNMSTLTKGMYVIQVVGDNLNLTEKVIKQ